MKAEIIQGDITELAVDAIVNAANKSLLGGGGVDGAIHMAAGPELLEACRVRRKEYPDGLPVGQAIITEGYNLHAKYVIHTVGPVYSRNKDQSELLADCYRNSLTLAEEHELVSIAFPAISTGVYGYPRDEAAHVVKGVLDSFLFRGLMRVVLCFYSNEDRLAAERVFGAE